MRRSNFGRSQARFLEPDAPVVDWRGKYPAGSRVRFQITPDGPVREGTVVPNQGHQVYWLKVREARSEDVYFLLEQDMRD